MAGRPKYEITEKIIKRVESLASQGLTKGQIAQMLGISFQTLNEKTKEYSELSEAIKNGQAKGIATITNALFQGAKKGNTTAQIFFLKNRAPNEWKDRVADNGSGDAPQPESYTIKIVDARKQAD